MPGLLHRAATPGGGGVAVSAAPTCGIWSRQSDELTVDQLQKFWNELPCQTRQELLRIDKQTLFEQARKNLYCSRCNGLLLEGFSQIVLYGKSLQLEGGYIQIPDKAAVTGMVGNVESDDIQDPAAHPWGGLIATRDGILTILDCFLRTRSLKALLNVFDGARARERERELLYPDACGAGGRGWISQGVAGYGRGHGNRETCALHTARLSCDTLVDFWSALGDETRFSLLRMKEEDFMERLMYRFDSKRFCRDCRRNVVREFKELKELKRMRRETRCTNFFCITDTAFQCEVSEDTVEADWHDTFRETAGAYHHFEWAVGTAEGKSDILDFEDVGMNGNVLVNGLDLSDFSSCVITLRAWKLDGRCTELSVKAHALRGQLCVHRRLAVVDGYVTITKGESIRRFFEHAEEAEEEEDDDAMDKDENDYDDGSRPQKHAKSPELAREFLLDAATVIFKDQVEKAFREGTARQNAHSIFVSLSLKLLEERLHVACKEIITLEKQIKLLEEEENEKREEEERKERRRTKEREKKNRRKERLKGKERERERKCFDLKELDIDQPTPTNDSSASAHEESPVTLDSGDSTSDQGDASAENTNHTCGMDETSKVDAGNGMDHQCEGVDEELDTRDSGSSRRKLRYNKDDQSKWYDKRRPIVGNEDDMPYSRCTDALHKPTRGNFMKSRNCCLNYNDKFQGSVARPRDRYDFHSCGCHPHANDSKPASRTIRETGHTAKKGSNFDPPRAFYRSSNGLIPKGKQLVAGAVIPQMKQVWEPMDSSKKYMRRNSDPDINSRSGSGVASTLVGSDKDLAGCQSSLLDLDTDIHSSEVFEHAGRAGASNTSAGAEGNTNSTVASLGGPKNDIGSPITNGRDRGSSSSSSDNCSSCLGEGDGSASSSSGQSADSSSTSDSEEAAVPQSDGNGSTCKSSDAFDKPKIETVGTIRTDRLPETASCDGAFDSLKGGEHGEEGGGHDKSGSEYNIMAPQHQPSGGYLVPIYPSPPPMGFHHDRGPASWSMPFHQPNGYVYHGPVAAYGPSDFLMRYGGVRPIGAAPVFNLCHHPSSYQTANGGVDAQVSKEPPRNTVSSPSPPPRKHDGLGGAPAARQNGAAADGGDPSFSLFHFSGPVAGGCARVPQVPCSRDEMEMEEYSLFSSGNAALFSFF